jgi:hypothetical protein
MDGTRKPEGWCVHKPLRCVELRCGAVGDGNPGISALSGESLVCSLCLLMCNGQWNTCLTAAVGSLWVCSQLITPLCRVQQSKSSHSHYIGILDDRKVGKRIYEIMVASPILAWCSCKGFWKCQFEICLGLQRHEYSTVSSWAGGFYVSSIIQICVL